MGAVWARQIRGAEWGKEWPHGRPGAAARPWPCCSSEHFLVVLHLQFDFRFVAFLGWLVQLGALQWPQSNTVILAQTTGLPFTKKPLRNMGFSVRMTTLTFVFPSMFFI